MSSPEQYQPNPSPAAHYERAYAHLAHAEVSTTGPERLELVTAAVAEAAMGLLLAFVISQPGIDNPEQPEPQPQPEQTT